MDFIFKIPVRDQEIDVTMAVTTRPDSASASFKATINDKHLSADTLEDLRKKLMNETKRATVKVAIPFQIVGQKKDTYGRSTGVRTLVPGTITGYHAGNHKPLVRWADGSTDQLSVYTLLKPLPGEDAEKLVEAYAKKDAADATIRHIEHAYSFSVKDAVEKAISDASGTEPTKTY